MFNKSKSKSSDNTKNTSADKSSRSSKHHNQNPPRKNSSRVNLVLNEKTPFNVREAYKSTRTNIIFSLPEKECKRIIITSAFPKEGKTTTCVNLAITFAETNARVLLIDADLRKPRIHKMLRLNGEIALTNVLSGLNKPLEAVQHSSYSGLDVIAAGRVPPNPAEMLASAAMKQALDELSQHYDYIFIDTPPINVVTDAMVLSSIVSGVYLVVRQNFTDHRSIRESLMKFEIANVKPTGFILNDTEEMISRYRYRYRYGYKYGNKSYYKYGGYSGYGGYGGYGGY